MARGAASIALDGDVHHEIAFGPAPDFPPWMRPVLGIRGW